MSLIGKLNYTGEKSTVDILSQIWNSVADTIEILEGRQMDILAEFLGELFSATQPEKVQDDTFLMVRTLFLNRWEQKNKYSRAAVLIGRKNWLDKRILG